MHTTSFVRRNAVKLFATVALVAGAAGVAGVGTFGAFTDTTSAEAAVSSGEVSVLMNGAEGGVRATASKMVPGDSIAFPVRIERAADSAPLGDLTVRTSISARNALTDALRLSVDTCEIPWTVSGKTMTCPAGKEHAVLQPSPLGGDGATNTWGPTAGWVPTLNTSTAIYVRATLTLPQTAGNEAAGLSTSVGWTLTGTQKAGEASVVQPTGF